MCKSHWQHIWLQSQQLGFESQHLPSIKVLYTKYKSPGRSIQKSWEQKEFLKRRENILALLTGRDCRISGSVSGLKRCPLLSSPTCPHSASPGSSELTRLLLLLATSSAPSPDIPAFSESSKNAAARKKLIIKILEIFQLYIQASETDFFPSVEPLSTIQDMTTSRSYSIQVWIFQTK